MRKEGQLAQPPLTIAFGFRGVGVTNDWIKDIETNLDYMT